MTLRAYLTTTACPVALGIAASRYLGNEQLAKALVAAGMVLGRVDRT